VDAFLGQWTPLLWFLLGFASLVILTRWINAHLQGLLLLLGADGDILVYLQFVIFAPGIFAHEASHWLAAKLLGVKTLQFSVWPKRKGKSKVQYGAVRIAPADVFRSSLIGLAPFIGASMLIIVIGRYALGAEALRQVVAQGKWGEVWNALLVAMRAPDFWLWLYLIFAISNAMFPSQADRESWRPVAIYLVIAGTLIYVSGWQAAIRTIPGLVAQITNPLIYAFGITAVADVVFAALIGAGELALGAIRNKKVQYHPPR
jgi:hypothetical protein